MKKILCPIGLWDDLKNDIFEKAVQFSKVFDCPIYFLYVCPELKIGNEASEIIVDIQSLSKKLIDSSTVQMEKLLSDPLFQDIKKESLVVLGEPADKIIEIAEKEGADMIIMGSHGRRGMSRLFMGSVAEKVARMSSVPVLIVRPKE